jgi:hypothetical protein
MKGRPSKAGLSFFITVTLQRKKKTTSEQKQYNSPVRRLNLHISAGHKIIVL